MTSTAPPLVLPSRFDDDERARIRARLGSLVRRRLRGEAPRAAVLVPLCHVDGMPSVLFTKRTETVGTHKGHVAFPGGRCDPDDVDDVATALRETEEEIGVPRGDVEVLGAFHEAIAITGMHVTPIVAYLGDVDPRALQVSPHEIESAFALPLAQLCDPATRSLQRLGTRAAPVFTAGPWPVWGLTAWILDEVLQQALGLPLPRLDVKIPEAALVLDE